MQPHRLFLTLLAACPLVVGAVSGAAAQEGWDVEGKYELVQPPQPTDTPGKVEVVELFWYGCPHCFRFLPAIEDFERRKPSYVELRRMPAIFRESWEIHARAYYTAKVLGVVETVHRPLFEAIHQRKEPLDSKRALREFFVARGVDGKAFDDTFESFAVESLLRKSLVMQGRYGIRGTPAVIVNGKYRISGSLAGSFPNMIKVIETLAEREQKATVAYGSGPRATGVAGSLPQSDQAPG